MTELNVKLDVFEGPLDLLLHLIKQLEIDIYDIPISEITEQYLEYIHTMKVLDLELAGEYIVMAATLMSIKSKMLLPKQEIAYDEDSDYSDEGEDPRDALVAQLLEYRKYKYAADVLKDKEIERGHYYTKEAANLDCYREDVPPLEPNQITTIDLFFAFHEMLNRQKAQEPLTTTIVAESFTIEEKIDHILTKLTHLPTSQGIHFNDLFTSFSKSEIVTTFMALLEVVKSGDVVAKQATRHEPIYLYRRTKTRVNE